MKKMLSVAALFTVLSLPLSAQCVMCYRTAQAQNQARSRVLDLGILILGAPPFLILAGFVAFVFSKDKQFRRSGTELEPIPGDNVESILRDASREL
ncbi:MAG TPA: hypothetical protein VHW09_12775 [Bryobacteraceae bacterium]|jgi:hypothetical protein|nr:hypothetical protein [Bryobacteraceae bacterium]